EAMRAVVERGARGVARERLWRRTRRGGVAAEHAPGRIGEHRVRRSERPGVIGRRGRVAGQLEQLIGPVLASEAGGLAPKAGAAGPEAVAGIPPGSALV